MKFIKPAISLVCVCGLAITVSELRAQDTLSFTLMFKNQDFELVTQDGYDRIIPKRANLYSSGNPGEPELPVYFANFIIPPGKVVTEVIIRDSQTVRLPRAYNIYPVQEPPPDPGIYRGPGPKFTDPDSSIYGSDSLFPGVVISDEANDGSFDGATIASVEVRPIQYRPLSGRLYLVRRITFSFVLMDVSALPPRPAKRAPHIQPLYLAAMEMLVENDNDVLAYYPQPVSSPNTWDCALVASRCVLETGEIDPYIEWLWERGYRTRVWDVQDLGIGGDPYRLQAHIRDWWQNDGTSFVQFVGFSEGNDGIPRATIEQVRIRFKKTDDTWSEWTRTGDGGWQPISADIFYSSLCDWGDHGLDDTISVGGILYQCEDETPGESAESCGDGLYGGNNTFYHKGPDYDYVDFFPEVFVGRVYIDSVHYCADHTRNWVEKVMVYEKNPGNADGLTQVKVVERDYAPYPTFFRDLYRGYVAPYLPPYMDTTENYAESPVSVINELNSYSWGWVDLYCHGKKSDFSTRDGTDWTEMVIWSMFEVHNCDDWTGGMDLEDLTNENKYFIVYDIAERNADFREFLAQCEQSKCVMEGFTAWLSKKGAVAIVSNTTDADWCHQMIAEQHGRFYRWLYSLSDVYRTAWRLLGPPHAFSKQKGLDPQMFWDRARTQAAYVHDLFGSPLIPVWTRNNPSLLSAEHPSTWGDGLITPFRVKVKDGNQPVRGAMVTLLLYDNSTVNYPTEANVDVYARALTGPDGMATFSIAPTMTGQMKVTATKHDYLPYLGTCQVSAGKAKRGKGRDLLPEKLEINTPTVSAGDCAIQLAIPLENEGQVSLILYDATGRLSVKIYEGYIDAGYHEFSLNTRLSSGVYFLRLEAGIRAITRKVVIR